MPTSTVRRERLVSPLVLALTAGLFALAFFILKPATIPGTGLVGVSGEAFTLTADIDALDLAYLRAEKHSGKISDADMSTVVRRLARGGRVAEARQLLMEFPALAGNEPLRFEVDLAQAAAQVTAHVAAQPAARATARSVDQSGNQAAARSGAASKDRLALMLQQLIETPALQQEDLLEQAVSLSHTLDQPRLSAQLYARWSGATGDPSMAIRRYRYCAAHFVANSQPGLAQECLQAALERAEGPAEAVAVRLDLLLLSEKGSAAQQTLIDTLMAAQAMPDSQRETLATTLLQIERPDQAYRQYAYLASEQPDRSGEWLPLAARWAEAAGKPAEAAVFLDTLLNSTGSLAPSAAERERLQQQVQSLLLAAGRTRDAYERISRRIRNQPDDSELLRQGIPLAQQLSESAQALAWNSQLLALVPEDEAAMMLQRELAMATGNLPLAMEWASRLVTQLSERKNGGMDGQTDGQTDAQNDERIRQERQRLARISEWNGQLDTALSHWQWLGRQPSAQRLAALREVVRLAEMTFRPGIAAAALRELTLLEKPDHEAIATLATLYELEGRSDQAAVALQDLIALHGPDPFVLRLLARLEYQHGRFSEALAAWQRFVQAHGHTSEATLTRAELLWRLDRKDEAAAEAEFLKDNSLPADTSDYQLRLLGEIGFRYRKPWLTLLAQPRILTLDENDQQTLYGRRALNVLRERGKDQQALEEAVRLWGATGETDFALIAMQLAVKVEDRPVLARFEPSRDEASELRLKPAYWSQLAATRIREGDPAAARLAYEQALRLEAGHVESMAGLIWLAIGEQDEAQLQKLLDGVADAALEIPQLWQAMAIGYLQLGAPSLSLEWFDRLLDDINTDYGMLLTYADALEYAGRSGEARQVRQYTLRQLRPQLVDGAQDVQALLLRQYTRLSARYAGTSSNQQLVHHLLKTGSVMDGADRGEDSLWREDMAISWLMSTQQHEQARLIMADIHARRLEAPAWQQLALALKDDDEAALRSLIGASGTLSIGNHILALRQLGNDREAYRLAQLTLQPGAWLPGSSLDDQRVAREQYVSLREIRPGFIAGSRETRSGGGLQLQETGVLLRHTFAGRDLGMSMDLKQRVLDSDRFDLSGNGTIDDLALSLYFGNLRQDGRLAGRLTAGFLRTQDDERVYGSALFASALRNQRSRISTELAYDEAVNLSPELLIGARQHRLTLGYDADVGRWQFLRLQADATDIHSRIERSRVSRGIGGSVEYGVRGSFGSNNWSSSVRAGQIKRDRATALPAELRFSDESAMDRVLAEEVQSLSVGASLARGGTNTDFPQVGSPRYYINTSLAHVWPDQVLGFQVDAGAGIRVLGGDELSFSVSHDTQPGLRSTSDATALGVNYRYHFQ